MNFLNKLFALFGFKYNSEVTVEKLIELKSETNLFTLNAKYSDIRDKSSCVVTWELSIVDAVGGGHICYIELKVDGNTAITFTRDASKLTGYEISER